MSSSSGSADVASSSQPASSQGDQDMLAQPLTQPYSLGDTSDGEEEQDDDVDESGDESGGDESDGDGSDGDESDGNGSEDSEPDEPDEPEPAAPADAQPAERRQRVRGAVLASGVHSLVVLLLRQLLADPLLEAALAAASAARPVAKFERLAAQAVRGAARAAKAGGSSSGARPLPSAYAVFMAELTAAGKAVGTPVQLPRAGEVWRTMEPSLKEAMAARYNAVRQLHNAKLASGQPSLLHQALVDYEAAHRLQSFDLLSLLRNTPTQLAPRTKAASAAGAKRSAAAPATPLPASTAKKVRKAQPGAAQGGGGGGGGAAATAAAAIAGGPVPSKRGKAKGAAH